MPGDVRRAKKEGPAGALNTPARPSIPLSGDAAMQCTHTLPLIKPTAAKPPPQPVAATARWLHVPVLPCPLAPAGLPGLVWIESQTQRGRVADCYLVAAHVENGQLLGWRFVSSSGNCYDVDDVHGSCDCPDSQFRQRPCKHVHALWSLPSSLNPPPASIPPAGKAGKRDRRVVEHIEEWFDDPTAA